MFEERMIAIEGAEDAFATATGMAAVSGALFCMLKNGDHIISSKALFGSCMFVVDDILRRWGIEVTLVEGTDLNQWRDAMQSNTKVCFLESISNPTLEVCDIAGVAGIAHAGGAKLVVDNVFATPLFQQTLKLGADVVIYSATKHIDGQGRCLGGIVLGSKEYIQDIFIPFNKHTGPAMSPFNAWVMLKGLETISLRCEAQAENAKKIVNALKNNIKINRILYPTDESHPQYDLAISQMTKGGTVVSFEVNGGKDAAFRFLNALKIITISNNLGDAKSLVTHPVTTTHKNMDPIMRNSAGISDGFIRLSVGLEDPEDLILDLMEALQKI